MQSSQSFPQPPYDKITQYNPLDIHVIGIVPKVEGGVLSQIELKLGKEDESSYHDTLWFKKQIQDFLSDGKEWKKESIYAKLQPEFNIGDHKKLKGGTTRGYSNLSGALDLLKKEGVLENPRKGIWRLRK